jgi:secreted PhoX family phosphatase
MPLSRRDLMKASALAGLGSALAAGSVEAVFGTSPAFAAGDGAPRAKAEEVGFGPLVRDPAGLLDLPAGFAYTVLSRAGEPLTAGTGTVPGRPDGTAAFAGPRGGVHLVTNHEQGIGAPFPAVAAPGLT